MKKLLLINNAIVAKSYLLFPILLLAFSVTYEQGKIGFVWPFIFCYSVEMMIPYVLDGRFNLQSWSEITKLYAIIAFIGGVVTTIGVAIRVEWLASIGAIGIGIGVTALKLSADDLKSKTDFGFKSMNLLSGIGELIVLFIIELLLRKVSLTASFIFYDLILAFDIIFAYVVIKRAKTPLTLKLPVNVKIFYPAVAVLIIALIISLFKKTGYISDLGWIVIILALIGLIIQTRHILQQPFKLFRIWVGAITNYLIIYTLLLAFQQAQAIWIVIFFSELIIAGIIIGIISKPLQKVRLRTRYRVTLPMVAIGLILTYFIQTYLLGAMIVALGAMLLGSWANQQAHDKYQNASAKLSVFGSLCCQIVLFGALEIISSLNLDSSKALILPFITHKPALQYGTEMLYLRAIMIIVLILAEIFVVSYDWKNFVNKADK